MRIRIVTSRLDYVQHVFHDRHTYEFPVIMLQSIGILFPTGLLALKGDIWKRHARFILPMLKRAKIVPFQETIVTAVDPFIDKQFANSSGKIHMDLIRYFLEYCI